MQLIDVHGPVVVFVPLLHPFPVLKFIGPVHDPGSKARPKLHEHPVRIAVHDAPPLSVRNAVFIIHPRFCSLHHALKDAGLLSRLQLFQHPAVEITLQLHLFCIWRIDPEGHAVLPHMCPKILVCVKHAARQKFLKIHRNPPCSSNVFFYFIRNRPIAQYLRGKK